MKTRLILLALVIFASGCWTRSKHESNLQSWVGSTSSELFEGWGPPTSTFALPDGRKMFTWNNNQGARGGMIAGTLYAVKVGCEVTFTVSTTDRVESWRYQGNNCY